MKTTNDRIMEAEAKFRKWKEALLANEYNEKTATTAHLNLIEAVSSGFWHVHSMHEGK